MNKKICFLLVLAAIASLAGCNKTATEQTEVAQTIQTESTNPSEIKSIKPGVWAAYCNEDKTDFSFYYFYNEAELAADSFFDQFTGAGYSMDPVTTTGVPITYVVDGDDLLMTMGGVDCEIYSKITFENENKFITVNDAEKTSPELYNEETSRRTFVFLKDMNLQEFHKVYSEEKILNCALNYYDSVNASSSDAVKVLKTDENNDNKYVRADISVEISTPENTEDNSYFTNAVVKIGDTQFTVDRLTGILTDEDGNEIDLSRYENPSSAE